MNTFRAVAFSAVTALGVVCSAAAWAETSVPEFKVTYNDLDLQSDKGAQELYSRLRIASRHVCARFEGQELRNRNAKKNCFEQALTKAIVDLNVDRLTALHQRSQTTKSS